MTHANSVLGFCMKKIIFTVTNDLIYDQRMIRICSTLTEAGYEVELIGRKKKGSKALSKRNFKQTRLNCFFQKGKLFYLEYNLRLFLFLLFKKADLFVAIDLDTILPVFGVAKLKNRPITLDAHEYFTETPEVERRPAVKWIWETLARLTIPNLKTGMTVCESLAEVFEKRYGTPFKVVRNVPFKTALVSAEASNTPKVLLYQGYLNEGRGLEYAIEAMQYLEGTELWLAGDGDIAPKLKALVKVLGLEEKVRFLGYVLPEELKAITAKAFLGLNLLENRSLNYYYSLANKAFDYIQAEVPGMHMNFPEYQKINTVFEVAVLMDDLDPEKIAEEVERLLQDEMAYGLLKENCRKAREVFVWEEEKGKLLEFIDYVIG